MVPVRRPSAVYRPEYRELARRVREARKEAGMTQAEVAERLGRPVSFVSKCELGERRMDPIDLKDFAELYAKPFEYFFADTKAARGKKTKRAGATRRRRS
jgi:transcriptional regulator with XRE-family HTH domain